MMLTNPHPTFRGDVEGREKKMEDKKLQRMEYLTAVLDKFTKTEPQLSLKDIAQVLVWQVGDLSELIREVKKENKKI